MVDKYTITLIIIVLLVGSFAIYKDYQDSKQYQGIFIVDDSLNFDQAVYGGIVSGKLVKRGEPPLLVIKESEKDLIKK